MLGLKLLDSLLLFQRGNLPRVFRQTVSAITLELGDTPKGHLAELKALELNEDPDTLQWLF